jgi:hypothetical protein
MKGLVPCVGHNVVLQFSLGWELLTAQNTYILSSLCLLDCSSIWSATMLAPTADRDRKKHETR